MWSSLTFQVNTITNLGKILNFKPFGSFFKGSCPLVDLKIMIPNGDVITVQVKRNSPTPEVHFAVMEKTRVQQQNYRFFAIFEIVEHNFGKI